MKLSLDLDALHVTSFAPEENVQTPRGTVRGQVYDEPATAETTCVGDPSDPQGCGGDTLNDATCVNQCYSVDEPIVCCELTANC
jgi:hypothetical protein